ncbi:hypothetical protein SERLADRAFT_380209 [Serpula lacrymans var. lacrymans S7.9]|uniref:Uncharacterized protein n=1 Tax=Serpula lacrymans var. lacrymans (strain S7.9) TaxID=578457 RepID=F8NKZ2_SERL9|nr:uncharacterized protein SERLADRAFT_380209 [Serpula lacrymans var. lacrymans S7.9]EGO28500.1 hypothetical protein SERLADRAFT_380209 [Serpula lacrymans var. lacrymans S7.9]
METRTEHGNQKPIWTIPTTLFANFILRTPLNPLAPRKLRGMDSKLFNSLFQPMPENLTTTSGIWSRLEVEP